MFVRDNLPYNPKKNECGILNLDDTSGAGTHWVAWYRKNKVALSAEDDKRVIMEDGINTLALGHYNLTNNINE